MPGLGGGGKGKSETAEKLWKMAKGDTKDHEKAITDAIGDVEAAINQIKRGDERAEASYFNAKRHAETLIKGLEELGKIKETGGLINLTKIQTKQYWDKLNELTKKYKEVTQKVA